ncbi:tyrosyl-tRNA synthetase, putative, partial [Eimeria maxima]
MATSAAEGGAVQRSSSSSSSNSSSNSNSNNSNSSNSNGNNNSSSSSSNSSSSSSNSSKGPDIFSGYPPPIPSTLSLEERIARCLSVAEECIQEDELAKLLEKKQFPIAYDGFEPSGRMHIAQGLLKVKNVNKLTSAGCIFVFWVADWFAMLNNKMGGDLKKIRKVGEYFIEVWKSAGMKMDNVRFLWASEEIGKAPEVYWQLVMNIAKANSIS